MIAVAIVIAMVAAYAGLGAAGVHPVAILVLAVAAVAALLVRELRFARVTLDDLGLRVRDLRRAAPAAGLVTALFAAAAVAWAVVADRPLWSADLAWMLPLYPLWGIAQQTLFQGILHRNLRNLLPPVPAILVTTTVFAFAHSGNPVLVGLTAVAGLVWSALYARCGNTVALGISHGIAAALAYPLILAHQPLAG